MSDGLAIVTTYQNPDTSSFTQGPQLLLSTQPPNYQILEGALMSAFFANNEDIIHHH